MSTQTVTQAAGESPATEPRVDPTSLSVTAADNPKLFNRYKNYSPTVMDPASTDGKKRCTVRYPTDEEWCERAKRLVSVRKALDGGRSKSDTPRENEANEALFKKIRIDSGPEFDSFEAMHVIEKLERATPTNCARLGVNYTITMQTFNGREVIHVLRMPSQKERMDFGRAAVQITSNRQTTETRVALEPVRDLWLRLVQSCEGYVTNGSVYGGVPVVHMSTAINELLAQVESDAEAVEIDPED